MDDGTCLYRVWWDDDADVARTAWQKGAVCTIREARDLDTAVRALGRGPVLTLVDLRNLASIDRDAREFLNDSDAYLATAFVVGSAATRMMANFFLGLQRGKSPNRMFSADSEALAWLHTQRR